METTKFSMSVVRFWTWEPKAKLHCQFFS